ncbi:hypothetical protein B0H11DRAFT_317335 [Mycena galericulata]|nr:hypothetical protein B0H11DRAFT_317335 [Mycena galericulata]
MDVSPEAYRDIVRNVGRRSDIAALCGVCRGFRRAAERALYNTLTVSDADPRVLATLAESPRIAGLVVALTVLVRRRGSAEREDWESSQEGSGSDVDARSRGSSVAVASGEAEVPHLSNYWPAVGSALRHTTRLRYLTIDIADPEADGANAWLLSASQFQLHTFHCDFNWDHSLRAFLATQRELHDLFIRDYREPNALEVDPAMQIDPPSAPSDPHRTSGPPQDTLEPHIPLDTSDTTPSLLPPPPPPLPALTTLECTFSEAAVALVPARPLSRIKTCFSHTDPPGRRAELAALLSALRLSARPIRALDIADALYTESGSMELLHRIAHSQTTARELRYIGTLVLPVGGRKRLNFYGLLMRLHMLRCIEVDVSAWRPPPSSSPAFRALTAELRLYCPDVDTVIFVHDFERTVVNTTATRILKIDNDAVPELIWREI